MGVFLRFAHLHMNFPLKYFENHLPEDWLIAGEELFEEGAVEGLSEPERNLWLCLVNGSEVEVQLSPSRVKAATCDCTAFKKEKGCVHIAAALFSLRNHLQQKAAARETVVKGTAGKKTNLLNLIQQVPPAELVSFIGDYARQNRAFALALKARFTGLLPVEDRREKYLELLDSAIKALRNRSERINSRGARQLAQVTGELLAQAEEAIAEKHPQEAAIIITSILEKIGPVARKTEGKESRLMAAIAESFSLLRQIHILNPAPELLQATWEFCLRESRKFIFRQSHIQLEYLTYSATLAPALGKTDEFLEHLRDNIREMETADPNRPRILILIHQILMQKGDTGHAQEHLLENLHEPVFLLHVVEEAIATGHWKKARFLAEKGLESGPFPASQSEKLEEHLFRLSLQERDRESVLQFGTSRFLQSKDPQYLGYLKSFARGDWPKLADDLLEKLEGQPYSLLKRDAIARLLFEEERYDDLFQYIIRLQSLDLLGEYGPSWPADRTDQAERLYGEILNSFLNNHLGRKPSQRVREMLEQLFGSGMNGVAERLLERFRNDFAGRQSLMEELEVFHS